MFGMIRRMFGGKQAKEKAEPMPGQAQFEEKVFPAELEEINKRRETYSLDKIKFDKNTKPSSGLGLVGLALSGGGIRSATFNLGVLQAFSKHGLLKFVDYLSTVSGGGYIGACLTSALTQNADTDWEKFPFKHSPGGKEKPVITHLRNSGNYAAPKDILDWLRIPALLIRGAIINFFVLLPIILFIAAVRSFLKSPLRWDSLILFLKSNWVLIIAAGGFLLLVATYPVVRKLFGEVNWSMRNAYERVFGFWLLMVILGIFWEIHVWVEPIMIGKLSALKGKNLIALLFTWDWKGVLVFLTAIFPVYTSLAGMAAGAVGKWVGKLAIYFLATMGAAFLYLTYLLVAAGEFNWKKLLVAGVLLLVFNKLFVSVNTTSLNRFYRDRLSKAYLVKEIEKKPSNRAEIGFNDELKLSSQHTANNAPYHLINAALNIQGTENLYFAPRGSDFFLFSKHYCGSWATGYCRTENLEKYDSQLDFGTAVAISGAAVNSNMGVATSRPLTFIMTLLNVRLGYWLPNPSRIHEYLTEKEKNFYGVIKWWNSTVRFLIRLFGGVGPIYLLLTEILSHLNEKSRFVNLSDGGHIENMGIVELLRRRCKFIIVCDAEADPEMTFNGMAKAIRYARSDMGIEIDMNFDELRKGKEEELCEKKECFSWAHCAKGSITYDTGEKGFLLYVKSSLAADEKEYLREYRSRNPKFPHEPTADQFFDEEQFEAYRALGYHIVNRLFRKNPSSDDLDSWFENLKFEPGKSDEKIIL